MLEPIALPPTVGLLGGLPEKAPPEDSATDAALESGSVATILAAILREQRESNKKKRVEDPFDDPDPAKCTMAYVG